MNGLPRQSTPEDFALMRGGPFFRFMQRHSLDNPDHPVLTSAERLVLAWCVAWLPLLLLTWLDGNAYAFLTSRREQAEFILALPALLSGETYVNGRIASAARRPLLLGLFSMEDLSSHHAALIRAGALRDSPRIEGILVMLAYLMTLLQFWIGSQVPAFAVTGNVLTAPGLWYALVSYPLFWFVLLRWVWRFSIWAGVLVHMSRLDLRIAPTHADCTGGLRFLAATQASFSVVVFAVGCVVSTYTHDDGSAALTDGGLLSYARGQFLFAVMALAIVNLPLLSFSRKLLEAKRLADARFSALMAQHAREFEKKWFAPTPGQTPLGKPDMSSQIDLSSAFEQASKMRWIPYGFRPFLAVVTSALLLPLIPRLLADRELLDALYKTMPRMF